MPRRRLQQIVDELHQELASTDDLTGQDESDLKALLTDIQDVLSEDTESDDESVLADVRDATVRFESTHPRVTKALFNISELLRSIGIS